MAVWFKENTQSLLPSRKMVGTMARRKDSDLSLAASYIVPLILDHSTAAVLHCSNAN